MQAALKAPGERSSGVKGVAWYARHKAWAATWSEDAQPRRQLFRVSAFASESDAMAAAVQKRLAMVERKERKMAERGAAEEGGSD